MGKDSKNKMVYEMVSESIAGICNLLINSKPSDGPMIKSVVRAAISGIKADLNDMKLRDVDAEKLDLIKEIQADLEQGRYDLLPLYMSDSPDGATVNKNVTWLDLYHIIAGNNNEVSIDEWYSLKIQNNSVAMKYDGQTIMLMNFFGVRTEEEIIAYEIDHVKISKVVNRANYTVVYSNGLEFNINNSIKGDTEDLLDYIGHGSLPALEALHDYVKDHAGR